jgi:hypothetical protein
MLFHRNIRIKCLVAASAVTDAHGYAVCHYVVSILFRTVSSLCIRSQWKKLTKVGHRFARMKNDCFGLLPFFLSCCRHIKLTDTKITWGKKTKEMSGYKKGLRERDMNIFFKTCKATKKFTIRLNSTALISTDSVKI